MTGAVSLLDCVMIRVVMECECFLCRGFETEDGKASILLNTAVYGDVTIIVYHARAAFGGKVQGKVCSAVLSASGSLCSASVYLFVC